VGGASDQYSLGVVGYRMLTGRLPFEEDSVHTIIYKHVWERPPEVRKLRPDIPAFLAGAIDRAMAKDPGARFPTMESCATAVWPENPVEAVTGSAAHVVTRRSVDSTDAPTEVSQPTERRVAQPPPRRSRWPVAVASVVVLLGGGAAALTLTPPGRRLLQQAGLAAPLDTAAAPRDSTTLAPLVQAPPPAPVETTTVDTAPPPPASRPVRRPARDTDRAPVTQPAPNTPPAAPEIGYLTVNADPFGNVFVDNRLAGETPIYTFRVPAGRHVVEIRREGYLTLVDTVLVGSGETVRINRVLTPRQP
jgi:hypothetical protein